MASNRKISANILYDTLFNDVMLNNAINDSFEKFDLSDIDKSFIKRETTGIISNINYIDSIINEFSKVKTKKLDKNVLISLRIGIYEMLYMDKVPTFATINECVNLIKQSKNKNLSGYVNAILRNFDRNKYKYIEDVNNYENTNCYFRIIGDNEKDVLCELKNKNIDYYEYKGNLELKNLKVYFTKKYKDIIALDSFEKGYIYLENVSSIYLTDCLASLIDKNVEVLDVCSSPGGKIIGLVDLLNKKQIVSKSLSLDISKEKIDRINENLSRLNIKNINTQINDGTVLNKDFIDNYDVVICDVPCTGLGVAHRKPDITLKFSAEKRDSLSTIQQKILKASKNYVKLNGLLSYSTCTTTNEENEDQIKNFLSNNSNFSIVFEKRIDINDDYLEDGFYICIMKRNK